MTLPLSNLLRRPSTVAASLVAACCGLLTAVAAVHPGDAPSPPATAAGATAGPAAPSDPPRTTPEPQAPVAGVPAPLRPRELFGFAPWWTLDSAPGFDVGHVTTFAYFGLGLTAGGDLDISGPAGDAWNGSALAGLVARAHGAGDSVVLVATCFDGPTIHALLSDPAAASHAAAALADAVRAHGLDGVNLDVEGTDGADRAAYTAFVATVARALHAADPRWQVTVDSYTNSVSDPAGFIDAAAVSRAVDAVVVMGYELQGAADPRPVAPQGGEVAAVQSYLTAMPASSVILAIPLYGQSWPVDGPGVGAHATGPTTPMTLAQLTAAGHPRWWDPVALVPYTQWQDPGDGHWVECWYDDVQSLALKAALVRNAGIRGLGLWALGMDGDSPSVMAALLGARVRAQDVPPPTAATSPSPTGSAATATPAPPSRQPTPAPTPAGGGHPTPAPGPGPTPSPTPAPGPLP